MTLILLKKLLFAPSQATLNMEHSTVEITFSGVFFPQYEGKTMIDVNPGNYFLFSTNAQMSRRSFDQMQTQLINKLHVHLTLEPKKCIQLVLLPQIPHL